MTRSKASFGLALALAFLALAALAPAAHAQPWTPRGAYPQDLRQDASHQKASAARPGAVPTRVVLEMDGGTLRLNGRVLGADQMPAALSATLAAPGGAAQRFVFSGRPASTVEINGVRYRIASGGALEVDTDLTQAPDAVVSFLDPRGFTTMTFGARSIVLVNETGRYAAEQEYALELATHALATQVRALAPGDARTTARRLLQLQLEELFDFKQAQRTRELDALQRDLDALRQQLHTRARNREDLVRQRMVDLLDQ